MSKHRIELLDRYEILFQLIIQEVKFKYFWYRVKRDYILQETPKDIHIKIFTLTKEKNDWW